MNNMADGVSFSPDNLMPEIEQAKETGEKAITLYKSNKFEVFVPARPSIPLNEGLHIRVSDGHDGSDSPREVLARYTLALGSAKILAESGATQDAWANTIIEEGQTINVYGRVPEVEGSWRKPVNALNRNVPEVNSLEPNYNTQKLQELSGRYLPKWEQLADNIELFKNGVNGKDVNLASKEGFIVWENDKIKLELIANPHLNGLHLMVTPKEGFQRQWQTIVGQDSEQIYIQQTLEVTAVAIGVRKLLAEEKGEIHNSGNWAGGLKSTKEGGMLDLGKLTKNRKTEKRSHRPDIAVLEKQINTNMHAHVYIPENGSVVLPEMSKQEAVEKGREDVIEQWDNIRPITQVQAEEVRNKLGEGRLTKWLEENCMIRKEVER